MPIFAPVYRPTKQQQTFLARKQKRESKKRKRGHDSSDEDGGLAEESANQNDASRQASSALHPVKRTDPYHVAGHPREEPLPPPPFPHAPVEEERKPKLPIDEELAQLNPPLYVPTAKQDDKSNSFRRRHLDNLTVILHKSMLNGDWPRASRAWAILIRVEIGGRGMDVRRNGRWGIGAELLLRRGAQKQVVPRRNQPRDEDDKTKPFKTAQPAVDDSPFTAEGFKLAREYYERLVLQYPYTYRTQHDLNAMAIYPALFNVWIYEVQDRSKRAQKRIDAGDTSTLDNSSDLDSSLLSDSEQSAARRQNRSEELDQATAIAQRMDELLMSPPYDTSTVLLQLRGMVALWLSDLHSDQLSSLPINDSVSEDNSIHVASVDRVRENERHHSGATNERNKAEDIFSRLVALDIELPRPIMTLLSEDHHST